MKTTMRLSQWLAMSIVGAVFTVLVTVAVVSNMDQPASLVSINVPLADRGADVRRLDALPGIGPVLAERIVAERELNGPYTSLLDLEYRVEGIGPVRAALLGRHLVFGGAQ